MRLADTIGSVLAQKGFGAFQTTPEETVYDAVKKMAEHQVGGLVVTSKGKLVGMVTERDYARKVALLGRRSHEVHVRDIMVSPAWYVGPDNTVDECMALMTEKRIRHLPVLQNDTIMGVVSIGDLVKWIISAQDGAIRHLENYVSSSYPG
ncbi:MAG TPA: CBS domain-containing protein [Terriglobales bacterium]|nr:CBS domain-containing protein [Terriglobales bacterium]